MSEENTTAAKAEVFEAMNEKVFDGLLRLLRLPLVGMLTDTDRPDREALRELQAAVERVLAERRRAMPYGPPPEKAREGGG